MVLRAVAASSYSATGVATWYSEAPAGTCASPTLAFGTVVTVTNITTGARTVCTVADREADNPGRIVDLSTSGFSQIAPLAQGVVNVTVSW
jgi:rare lipoprotein A